ncbi:ABC transporter ATP-binding protein [Nocardioides sp. CPCC 205120]|uniref:ABC transporter ATP-binding protein n=1 Tax=Nocardioides sp. CPCC 205120 TaxID=3406462 RepID=UPI003B5103BF
MIEVQDLRKQYGGRLAVADVSFRVAEGEIFGVLGPNGAGKTTTVECIAGLRVGDAGSVRVAGLDPWTDRAGVTRVLGVQLQESRLQPKLRVAEAVELYASFYADPADGHELLTRLGLADHLDQAYGRLSGGQQQRLAVALALVGRPRVVILDELTTGLDPRARREVWDLVREVRSSGVTVLLVTHSMEEAEHLCDRIAIIDGGHVVALDTPAGLAGRPDGGRAAAGRADRGSADGAEVTAAAATAVVMSFVPDGTLATDALRTLPGATGVRREDDRVVLTGDDATVLAALDHLRAAGVRPGHLRVAEPGTRRRSLDEAYLSLTGGRATATAATDASRGRTR